MTVHVVINQKGGVGKSTLTINLAAVKNDVLAARYEADGADSPVLVGSVDPQGSAVWWADRVADLPFNVAMVEHPDQIRNLPRMNGIEHVILDTPGWAGNTPGVATDLASRAIDEALNIADLAIVPITPEPLSFDPTARTIEDVLKPKGVPFRVVVNNWDPRDGDVDLKQTMEFVRRRGWPLVNTVVRHYKVHTRAAAEGRVVTEYATNRIGLQAREDFQRLCLALEVSN
jgi:chromosome partitioning protein